MSRFVRLAVIAVMFLSPFATLAAPKKEAAQAPEPMKLKIGDTAPDFTLLSFDGKDLKKISLHDFRGKKSVALAFYVFAFTGG
jgi:cytochrome oxidase Cu insertion factor (SCO1/SenC/PrrC family)